MSKKRRNHSPIFKSMVELSAIRGDNTMSELSSEYMLSPSVIQRWKKQLLEGSKDIFVASISTQTDHESEVKELQAKIGQLTMERDFCPERSVNRYGRT